MAVLAYGLEEEKKKIVKCEIQKPSNTMRACNLPLPHLYRQRADSLLYTAPVHHRSGLQDAEFRGEARTLLR